MAALVGLGGEDGDGLHASAGIGADEAAAQAIHVFGDEVEWDVIEEIPNGSAAALILLEHHWAVPLRDALARAGGYRISDGMISPYDLVAVGLASATEAQQLQEMEKRTPSPAP